MSSVVLVFVAKGISVSLPYPNPSFKKPGELSISWYIYYFEIPIPLPPSLPLST